ncbi:A24 family peptidase [Lactobacillus sp. ESL0677]|uniref:prepilin peptidase n=1 Tax=Lactobacillus sp. ESL0677 TaxID=2983208 RepID=UPI0023F8E9DD|nr:A24 family peptidase [Lactobacillus sp. ESL0677]WEV36646.1 prepilin peptidase [Lactobacillus sp. ESL0677]
MNWIYTLTNFLIGTCLASHAAVVCDRWETSDFFLTRSRCNICQTELSILDELPVISYLWLHGKCRYCSHSIPINLPVIEICGGLAFSQIDFSRINGWATTILIFSLLLAAISDFEKQEFHLLMLAPALCLALFKSKDLLHFQFLDCIELLPILLLLLFFVWQHKLGSGDLLIYLILAIYFSPHTANLTFLIGSALLIVHFYLKKQKGQKQQAIAFVPYLFLGLTIQLLFK